MSHDAHDSNDVPAVIHREALAQIAAQMKLIEGWKEVYDAVVIQHRNASLELAALRVEHQRMRELLTECTGCLGFMGKIALKRDIESFLAEPSK
jgi:hypothetical protein